ncbi:iron-containing alcohol dehydrogenase [Tissierella sp. MSJ-40]|uniref:Iron-containing alcohol dehydrogenase n=1 Tax=Tissierella simiarum TaxID=2841534 RepID=A0ABS6E4N2_9FIRM|nr:1-propanol dehydrogenase PduQ [Tissierella simiarum]MBU5437526.1 iron-containing alcohol dehydrogenase [Tissierella simiarum]
MNNFNINTDIYFGQGSLDKLEEIRNKNVLIVTDEFMVKFGIVDKISSKLENCNIHIFSDIKPDPPVETIAEGIKKLTKSKPEVIIAIGGGSPIDAGKAIKELSNKIGDYGSPELIAIPTTSGTGSEVTMFSVITNRNNNKKYPLVSKNMTPHIAILDPELVASAPQTITADTGMDVITHAIEAYVSTNATDFTDAFAEKTLKLSFEYLPIAYKQGNYLVAREKMHNASCMAGLAFNVASLGLNHGIAHAVGGKFKIPHGRINGMLLPLVIEYNADLSNGSINKYSETAKKYYDIAKILNLPAQNVRIGVNNLIHEINNLKRMLKIPRTLTELGISEEIVKELKEELIKTTLADVCTQTNPKKPTAQDIDKIIDKLI